MTELPRPLARWRKQLAVFPDDLAASLGRLVLRLAPAFDALVLARHSHDGDVDGFDGITSRGSYERLLPSEWGLRETMPLEFLRRAASGEHAFFRLARREPAVKESTLVLLDAGPDQLGACRIVQLALLVLHFERGERRREMVCWQLLHHVGELFLHTLDAQTVRHFLDSRTPLRSNPQSAEDWISAHPTYRPWLIGSPALAAAAGPRRFSVSLRERVDPDARLVDLALSAPGRAPRSLSLELPEPRVAVRLIRNPFEAERPAPEPMAAPGVSSRLIFNPKGTRISYLGKSSQLISIPVPSNQYGSPGKPRRYSAPRHSTIIGVEWQHRQPIWLSSERGTIHLASTAPFQGGKKSFSVPSPFWDQTRELSPLFYFNEQMLTFVAPNRSLWRVVLPSNICRRIAHRVYALLPAVDPKERSLALVDGLVDEPKGPGPHLVEILPFSTPVVSTQPLSSVNQAFLRRHEGSDFGWTLGYESEPRLWTFANWNARQNSDGGTLHAPSATTVVGILRNQLGFYLLSDDRRELSRVTRHTSKVLLRTQSPIVDVAVAAAAPTLAALTADNELTVMLDDGGVRARIKLEEVRA